MSHPTITQNGALLHAHRQSGRRGDTRRGERRSYRKRVFDQALGGEVICRLDAREFRREMRRQIGAGKRGRRALRWQGFKNAVRRAWLNFKPASFRESDFPIS
jgi:hypothetical protein